MVYFGPEDGGGPPFRGLPQPDMVGVLGLSEMSGRVPARWAAVEGPLVKRLFCEATIVIRTNLIAASLFFVRVHRAVCYNRERVEQV